MKRSSLLIAGIGAMVLLVALLIRGGENGPPSAPVVETPVPVAETVTGPDVSPSRIAASSAHWLIDEAPDRTESLPGDEDQAGPDRWGTLNGRLVWKNRRLPLTDVEVAMTRRWLDTVLPTILEDEPDDPVLLERRVKTDEDGRFSIHPVPTDGNLFFVIGRGGPFLDFRKVPTLPLPGQTVNLGEIEIEERGRLTGRVVDQLGTPVVGAYIRSVDDPFTTDPLTAEELRAERNLGAIDPRGMVAGELVPDWLADRDRLLPFPHTRTGDDGRFSLQGVRPGQHVVFFRNATQITKRSALIAAERTTDLGEVHLAPANTISGTISYDDGEPVAGARIAAVSTDFGFGPPTMRADARGSFFFTGMASGVPVNILYRTSNGGPWELLGTITPELMSMGNRRNFVIDRPRRALFHVIDEQGAPIEGARVTLMRTTKVFRSTDVRLPFEVQPRVRSPGNWTASLSSWTGVHVVASAPGHAPAVEIVTAEAFEPTGLTLTMLRSFPMRFSVTDINGHPVAGAEVRAAISEAKWYKFPGSSWSRLSTRPIALGLTDEYGTLHREGFWGTNMVFAASHPEHVASPIQKLVPTAGLTVQLRLRLPGRIEGVVTEGRQTPARRWRIVAEPNLPSAHPLAQSPFLRSVTTITSPDGTFSFPKLHPGDWLLRPLLPAAPGTRRRNAQEEWLQRMAQPVHVQEGLVLYADMELEQPLWREASLAGEIELNGQPARGLVVRLYYREAPSRARFRRRLPIEPAQLTTLHSTLSDHAGQFKFFDIPSRTYLLAIESLHQGRTQRLASQSLDLREEDHDEDNPLRIDIRTGSLKCTLVGIDGRALSGRMVRVRQSTDGEPAEAGTGTEFIVLSDDLGMIELSQIPVGDHALDLLDDRSLRVTDPTFRIEPGQFTMRDFQVVEADR